MARLGCMVAAAVLATAQLFQIAIVAEAAKPKKTKAATPKETKAAKSEETKEELPGEQPDAPPDADRPPGKDTADGTPTSLNEMVELIQSEVYANNFHDGELLVDTAETDAESVGGCFLDKLVAVVEESAVKEFGNDFRLDVAGCCTKDTKNCIQDINELWTTLMKVHLWVKEEDENLDKESAQIAFGFLQGLRKRVKEERVVEEKRHYFKKCMTQETCTIKVLQEGVQIRDHKEELLQKSSEKAQREDRGEL